ncbi:MAG: hypothetical protein KAG18_07080 [Sinobacterium sp.]|nr:hypothetical protein [Sinobacterium sp.]
MRNMKRSGLTLFGVLLLSYCLSGCYSYRYYVSVKDRGSVFISPEKTYPLQGGGRGLRLEGINRYDLKVVPNFGWDDGSTYIYIYKPNESIIKMTRLQFELNDGGLVEKKKWRYKEGDKSEYEPHWVSFYLTSPKAIKIRSAQNNWVTKSTYDRLKDQEDDVYRMKFEFTVDDEPYVFDAKFSVVATRKRMWNTFSTGSW